MNKQELPIQLSREEILAVYAQGPDKVVELVENLIAAFNAHLAAQNLVIQQLQERLEELENRLSKDSHNSSKPPSSDSFKKKNSSSARQKKSSRKVGGQRGHPGKTLELSDTPDETFISFVHNCNSCGSSLENTAAIGCERRQVFDIPPLKLRITEHRAEIKNCPCCSARTKAAFPTGVNHTVQYGEGIKSLAIYLNTYQLLPYDRSKTFFEDIFSHPLSVASLLKANQACYELLEPIERPLKEFIGQSSVVNFDETGYRVNGRLNWLHVAATPYLTYYLPHQKRGRQAMDAMGILPDYQGRAIHDYWKPYYHYFCRHGLCNSHHLRELTFIHENCRQDWASEMIDLLLQIKRIADQARQFADRLDQRSISYFEKRYQQILDKGFQNNPPPVVEGTPKKKGRKKQSRPKNLLDRLKAHQQEVLAFMYDFNVPFDNNLAERDLRMMKIQQKIAGCFRTEKGARVFCRIRSYISSARKQGVNVLRAIKLALQGNLVIPQIQAE